MDRTPDEIFEIFDNITCIKDDICAKVLGTALTCINEARAKFENECEKLSDNSKTAKDFYRACWQFVEYQLDTLYDGDRNTFKDEGFTIGSPWHGDVYNAPVLFLGTNPNITKGCVFPRWHWEKGKFNLLGKNPNKLPDDLSTKEGEEELKEFIWDFLSNRFQNEKAVTLTKKGFNVRVVGEDGNLRRKQGSGVNYWGGMYKVMKKLVGENYEKQLVQLVNEDYARRAIMQLVLSSEIIPFGSRDLNFKAAKDRDVLDFCWDRFTLPLLRHCAASTLVLVGDGVRDTFGRSLGIENGTVKAGNFDFNSYKDKIAEDKEDLYKFYKEKFCVFAMSYSFSDSEITALKKAVDENSDARTTLKKAMERIEAESKKIREQRKKV